MNIAQFLENIQKNKNRINRYELGHDGSDGACDCIGLIIGAWRLGGQKWNWTHGSNYTARHLVDNLAENAPLALGDLVFKARGPQDSGYKLPDTYRSGPDLRDYYHVGVVTSAAPLMITHCTEVPGGIKTDSSRGKWLYSGQFKKLEREEEIRMGKTMIVTAESGRTVNLRSAAGMVYPVLEQVPVGDLVEVISEADGWAYIQYGNRRGYMMAKYLTEGTEDQAGNSTTAQLAAEAREAIENAQHSLNVASALLEQMQG